VTENLALCARACTVLQIVRLRGSRSASLTSLQEGTPVEPHESRHQGEVDRGERQLAPLSERTAVSAVQEVTTIIISKMKN
jgi:hypothetical protein